MTVNDYQEVLRVYAGFAGSYENDNPKIAEAYLQKYWLSTAEYKRHWQALQRSIFDMEKRLPDMIFKKDWGFVSLLGGGMLGKQDVTRLQFCMKETGDRHFVVIQDTFGMNEEELSHAFRMKYPAAIGWEELLSGDYISATLFDLPEKFGLPDRNHYLFGDGGQWGIYVASDTIESINLIGFEKSYGQLFRTAFKIPPGEYCENLDYIQSYERPNLKEKVPPPYRKVT